jgi:hypothetical protein
VSALTLVVLVVAAVAAFRQVREAVRTREEESRPYVVVDFETKKGMFFLVVTNIGRTMARDVRFSFNPLCPARLIARASSPGPSVR